MRPYLLSIVVPVYNGARTIGALVDALAGLKISGGHEIVLVNDGSPDDSEAVCRALARRSHRDVVGGVDGDLRRGWRRPLSPGPSRSIREAPRGASFVRRACSACARLPGGRARVHHRGPEARP